MATIKTKDLEKADLARVMQYVAASASNSEIFNDPLLTAKLVERIAASREPTKTWTWSLLWKWITRKVSDYHVMVPPELTPEKSFALICATLTAFTRQSTEIQRENLQKTIVAARGNYTFTEDQITQLAPLIHQLGWQIKDRNSLIAQFGNNSQQLRMAANANIHLDNLRRLGTMDTETYGSADAEVDNVTRQNQPANHGGDVATSATRFPRQKHRADGKEVLAHGDAIIASATSFSAGNFQPATDTENTMTSTARVFRAVGPIMQPTNNGATHNKGDSSEHSPNSPIEQQAQKIIEGFLLPSPPSETEPQHGLAAGHK